MVAVVVLALMLVATGAAGWALSGGRPGGTSMVHNAASTVGASSQSQASAASAGRPIVGVVTGKSGPEPADTATSMTATTTTTSVPAASSTLPTIPPRTTSTSAPAKRSAPETTTVAPEAVSTTTISASPNGDGTWTSKEKGITTTLQIDPVAPVVGQTVHFTVTATDDAGWCCMIGALIATTQILPSIPANPCPAPEPSTRVQEFDQVFTEPGSFLVTMTMSGGKLCIGPPAFVNSVLGVTVTVAPAS